MDFFNKLVEAIKCDEKQPGYIQGEIARFKHEKEIAKKTVEHKIKIISNILGEIDKVLKLNPTKSGLVFPQIREADYLDINGKPYGDWNGFRKRRREAGTFFPMANYDFLDPAGFNILHDDCEDMIDLLQSRGQDCTIDLMMDLLFSRCDLIATRFNYLRGCASINVNTAPDYLVADFSTAFASKRGKVGGRKKKICQPILKALQQFIEDETDLIQQSNKAITEKFTEWLLSDDRYITHAKREWFIYYVQDSKCIFAEPDKTTKTSKITSKKFDTVRKDYIPKIKKVGK